MRIGELADLAGVTVRTVRYYHQKDVLPEPVRRANGYREYTVDDLVALVRIRWLTRSGLSLSQAGAIVADSVEVSTDSVLDEVDEALRLRIVALADQRRRLAEARSGRHLGLSRLAAALATKPADIPISTLYAHLHTDQEQADRLTEALRRPEVRSALIAAQARFDAVDESTPGEELDRLEEEMRGLAAELVRDVPAVVERHSHLLLELAERDLNAGQRALLRRLA
ncbi:MerR family transcriptional regulator [Nocardiopsis alba]|uniref:helix-turn-helix domain-containing protein n=1 Tax=Nocardiopsis alba TaxID=53437 RepID=UPI00366DFE85